MTKKTAGITGGLIALAVLAVFFCACRRAGSGDARLDLLREILASRNDNDPRLDHGFDGLTEDEKKLFRAEYRSLPPEKRNERGTIVYLLGRELSTPNDWAFLREVVSEPRCLSLASCAKPAASPSDPAAGDDVTLAYPALVALKSAERAMEAAPKVPGGDEVVLAAMRSPAPAVARAGLRVAARFGMLSRPALRADVIKRK